MESNIDGFVKGQNYKELIKKYNQAIKRGFYLEATMIVYALIEDRLSSALCKLGIASLDNEGILQTHWSDKQNKFGKLRKIKTIVGKIELLESSINFFEKEWPASAENFSEENKRILRTISKKYQHINLYKDFFSHFCEWKDRRNLLVHSLTNFKSPDEIKETSKACFEKGYELFRTVDTQICRKFRVRKPKEGVSNGK